MSKPKSNDLVVLESRIKTREEVKAKAAKAVLAIFALLPMSQQKRMLHKAEAMRDAIEKEFQP